MVRNRVFLIYAVAGILLHFVSGLTARERVTITVDPTVAVVPATIRIRTEVQPDATNRALEVVVDSGEFYSSSELVLDGEHASRVNALKLRDLPAGEYRITATLTAADGQSWVARQRIQIRSALFD